MRKVYLLEPGDEIQEDDLIWIGDCWEYAEHQHGDLLTVTDCVIIREIEEKEKTPVFCINGGGTCECIDPVHKDNSSFCAMCFFVDMTWDEYIKKCKESGNE